jgi:rhamnogalacturonan endolyase
MGGHSLSVADVDKDGKDDIVYNSMVVKSDGTGLHTTGLRHGDALHVGDFDLDNPGLDVFGPHENEGFEWDKWTYGAALYDALTGKTLWGVGMGQDVGRALTGDIDPRHPGNEMWGIPGGLYDAKGRVISQRSPNMTNFVVWWDGDLLREMVNGNTIAKWDYQNGAMVNLLQAEGAQAAASTKSSPVVSADLFGDWREEVVFRAGNAALRIYTTTMPTEHRLYTLMHDPQYRLAIAWQNCTYNQPPWPSYFIGHDMKPAVKPTISVVPTKP